MPKVDEEEGGEPILPWVIGGLILASALVLLALMMRRRRRSETLVYDEVVEEPAPVAAAPIVAAERPWLEIELEPVRAGVTEEDARVEFALTVSNAGSAEARHVRISTWMVAAGSIRETEMERLLIEEPEAETELPETRIEAGGRKRIESAVALATAGIESDSVLPVVVAEALYRLPDGSEGRSCASFAVGLPAGGELAHFATDNPSGLHEGVEARPLETERA